MMNFQDLFIGPANFPQMMFISSFFIILIVFALIASIFWIWAFIDCLVSKLNKTEKLIWALIILFFNLFGAIAYLIISKASGKRLTNEKDIKSSVLIRTKKNRIIAGVCGALADYIGMDRTAMRVLWVLLTVYNFAVGAIAYIVLWVVIPFEKEKTKKNGKNKKNK